MKAREPKALGDTLAFETSMADTVQERIRFEELLARRVDAPAGTPALTDADIEQAILRGALGEKRPAASEIATPSTLPA